MKRPNNLNQGSKVRIVAPCGRFDPKRFQHGVELLNKAGFTTVFDDSIHEGYRYLAGTDDRRLNELRRALNDSEADGIWVARGGYGATRLVAQINPVEVTESNKWLIGFSDVTALHALWARAGVQSVHGANITTLGDWGSEARSELYRSLREPTEQSFSGQLAMGKSNSAGRLVGGNLAVLTAMLGTGLLPDFTDTVVLLEDIGERPYKLDRMLTQHRQAQTFDGVAGFIIGQLSGCEPGDGEDYKAVDVIAENLAHLGVPMLTGLPLGHDGNSRSVVLGAMGQIDVDSATFRIDLSAQDAKS
jgi:muramoyltetrapeptide carboxypeptidase